MIVRLNGKIGLELGQEECRRKISSASSSAGGSAIEEVKFDEIDSSISSSR